MNKDASTFDATSDIEATRVCEPQDEVIAPAPLTLNIDEILDLTKVSLEECEYQKIALAMFSIQKRLDYCEYHYSVLEERYDDPKFALGSVVDFSTNGIRLRTIYEANILAFLQNLHALIDSLPYALNIIIREFSDIEKGNIGWNKDFLKAFKSHSFYASIFSFFEDENYIELRNLVNKQKHKHLIRIRHIGRSLYLEEYPCEVNDGQNNAATPISLDAKTFLASLHDDLVPKYIHLWHEIKSAVEGTKTAQG